ncbi:hypothetical protein LAX15_23055 [Escherichia coli]|nr:hypothetical protein [Escherichia coli]MDD8883206.1 hypothetical protein [Escherichia coli]
MNKYLLGVLFLLSAAPGYCYTYEYSHGTMEAKNFFVRDDVTVPLDQNGKGVINKTPYYGRLTGPYDFQWSWTTTENTRGTTFDPNDIYLRTAVDTMFEFTNDQAVANNGWTPMGVYEFPTIVTQTSYECRLPRVVENDAVTAGGTITFEVESAAQGNNPTAGRMGTIRVRCYGTYKIRKNVSINLEDKEINLIGSSPMELTGGTKMKVSGVGGTVEVNIVNPNNADVTVSFDPARIETSKTMDLHKQPQYEQQIYVRGNTTVPGHNVYSVQLNAEFK